jgi:threonine/homoserine/homoserine lactone efflux protein
LLLGVTVCVIALPVNILLVCFSAKVTQSLRQNNAIATWLQKAMGAIFVALGLKLAAEKI